VVSHRYVSQNLTQNTAQGLILFWTTWNLTAYFLEIFPQSVTRLLQLHAALEGKPSPDSGWTILSSVMFVSSGWVNALLWVITGRQFGFTASSVRTLSDGEAGHDLGKAALARGDETRRKPIIPPQPAFPPSYASEPLDVSMSSFPVPSRCGYDTLAVEHMTPTVTTLDNNSWILFLAPLELAYIPIPIFIHSPTLSLPEVAL
jgi:hypothetical protein